MTVFGMKPMGMYLRLSDETDGISKYLESGWRISPNTVGVSANSFVVCRRLFRRCSRTPSTRFRTSGMPRISPGGSVV